MESPEQIKAAKQRQAEVDARRIRPSADLDIDALEVPRDNRQDED